MKTSSRCLFLCRKLLNSQLSQTLACIVIFVGSILLLKTWFEWNLQNFPEVPPPVSMFWEVASLGGIVIVLWSIVLSIEDIVKGFRQWREENPKTRSLCCHLMRITLTAPFCQLVGKVLGVTFGIIAFMFVCVFVFNGVVYLLDHYKQQVVRCVILCIGIVFAFLICCACQETCTQMSNASQEFDVEAQQLRAKTQQ